LSTSTFSLSFVVIPRILGLSGQKVEVLNRTVGLNSILVLAGTFERSIFSESHMTKILKTPEKKQ